MNACNEEHIQLEKTWMLWLQCVKCGAEFTDYQAWKDAAISSAQESGWRVGKRPMCPKCNMPAAERSAQ
jgi:hypothetical protein